MPDYQQGKIYKITGGDETYYGSTVMTIKKRMQGHKSKYNQWRIKKASRCAACDLFDKYGFDNCRIELVEDYSCQTKKDLLIREDYYMDNNICINERRANTSREQLYEKNKKWRNANKDKFNKLNNQYYHAKKEAILEKMKEKIVCECGRKVCKSGIARHRRSAFHLANI